MGEVTNGFMNDYDYTKQIEVPTYAGYKQKQLAGLAATPEFAMQQKDIATGLKNTGLDVGGYGTNPSDDWFAGLGDWKDIGRLGLDIGKGYMNYKQGRDNLNFKKYAFEQDMAGQKAAYDSNRMMAQNQMNWQANLGNSINKGRVARGDTGSAGLKTDIKATKLPEWK